MTTLKSWRWSRLFEYSAVKRLWTHPHWIIMLIITLVMFWLLTLYKTLMQPNTFEGLLWSCWLILVFIIFQNICCSDEYYEIKSGKKLVRKIYLYTSGYFKKNQTVTMIILGKDYEIHEQIEDGLYKFYQWKDFSSFLFWIDDNCYYSSPVADAQPLGHSIGTTAFVQPEKTNQIIVLDDHGTMTLEADAFFINGVYIPPLASRQIYDATAEEKLDKPQDYLVVKRGKRYIVYGLYYLENPACRDLKIPNIIFKEGSQDVVLQWNNEYGYREIFRSRNSVKRQVSDVFVELTYQHGIGGTIRKFNEQTQKFDLLYKGYFHAIDFGSGSILGDKGYEYIPET